MQGLTIEIVLLKLQDAENVNLTGMIPCMRHSNYNYCKVVEGRLQPSHPVHVLQLVKTNVCSFSLRGNFSGF